MLRIRTSGNEGPRITLPRRTVPGRGRHPVIRNGNSGNVHELLPFTLEVGHLCRLEVIKACYTGWFVTDRVMAESLRAYGYASEMLANPNLSDNGRFYLAQLSEALGREILDLQDVSDERRVV